MDTMTIAAMSMDMSMARVQQQAGLSMAKKAMDLQETQGAALIESLEKAMPVSFGHQLDVRV